MHPQRLQNRIYRSQHHQHAGILIMRPTLTMPALTKFIDLSSMHQRDRYRQKSG
jgi:hypothetical protein